MKIIWSPVYQNNYRSVTTQFSLIKIKFIIQNKKLSDLHTAQSNSYNSVDNDFMNKGDENNNKSNKSQSSSEFHDNTSFNKTFNTEVSIDDVINSYSEPTKELVISSYKTWITKIIAKARKIALQSVTSPDSHAYQYQLHSL